MKKNIIVHPFFFALFPVLALYGRNTGQVMPQIAAVQSLAAVAAAGAMLLFFYLLSGNARKSAFAVSLVILFIFSYSSFTYLSALLFKAITGRLIFARTMYRLPVYSALFFAAGWILLKAKYNEWNMTRIFNFVSLVLLVYPVIEIAGSHLDIFKAETADDALTVSMPAPGRPLPDIYYIILDGYARADTLAEIYGFDNSRFLQFLKSSGFYIAGRSTSNYSQTVLSVPSSLNMDYLPAGYHGEKIRNRVKNIARKLGYNYISIDPGNEVNTMYSRRGLLFNEFFSVLVQGSVLQAPLGRFNVFPSIVRSQVLDSFSALREIPQVKGPKFVFMHILSPHPPYVFGPEGEKVTRKLSGNLNIFNSEWDDRQGYLGQLKFVNSKITEAIKIILEKSPSRPVIIIQGDHGPRFRMQGQESVKVTMKIFNALYLPGSGRLYPDITPVNTFRAVFNSCFGMNIGLLADRNYYSTAYKPFLLEDVSTLLNPNVK